ncbi:endoglucanase, putative [Talaromyces stipitatus ATCC 10500]|uniref:cellulase n=1 Tax=Talaromyces stipitatus (strain ATCC 10500 / CBS 375.48 / QM 6759 / NRRL 1006) TaxID=441959 RepID=B8LUY9_TALSN|nr:endoglucanase, putative [Talaromyces stipitatus ATCC 10500]EED22610.1 endoglucanase, putative [Talaromyces stipitatus ATCC 10500]
MTPRPTIVAIASFAVLAVTFVQAQQSGYGQCGGANWTGATSCVSGWTCTFLNDYYSQCLPSSTTLTTSSHSTTSTTSSTATSTPTNTNGGKLKWFGVDESCAEFGTAMPGTWGVDYTFANTATIGEFINQGFNIFRIPFAMERMARGSVGATLDNAYLTNYSVAVDYITSNGAYAVLDAHNYGRYNGNIITDTSAFKTFWSNMATAFKNNSKVIFDTNNEYHDMDESLVFDLNQAAIDGIRGSGATTQYIFAEGNSWTGAWTWNTTNDSLKNLKDPENLLIYEMHQYLDSDGSGTSATCVSSTIGVERIEGATAWLKANGKIGVLGEYAGGPNSVCQEAVTGMLDHLTANNDVWFGAVWWAAGPWWPSSTWSSIEPPSGQAYVYYDNILQAYTP